MLVILVNLENLFTLLQPRGISKKLSEATGISSGNISDWKKGRSKPTAEALTLIADYFDVSVDYLLGREPSSETKKDGSVEALPSADNLTPSQQKLVEYASDLSNEELQETLNFIGYLKAKRKS